MPPQRITPYLDMRVWDIPNYGEIHFSAASLGTIDLGCIVENRELLLALEARIAELPTVNWVRSTRIMNYTITSSMCRDASEVHVETTGGSFVVKLLVGAGRSPFACSRFSAGGHDSSKLRTAGRRDNN